MHPRDVAEALDESRQDRRRPVRRQSRGRLRPGRARYHRHVAALQFATFSRPARFTMSPYRLKADNGFLLANRMLAGAFKFAKPNGNFARAFAGSSQGDAQKISAVYEKFLNGRHYDQLVNNQGKIALLRDDLK